MSNPQARRGEHEHTVLQNLTSKTQPYLAVLKIVIETKQF